MSRNSLLALVSGLVIVALAWLWFENEPGPISDNPEPQDNGENASQVNQADLEPGIAESETRTEQLAPQDQADLTPAAEASTPFQGQGAVRLIAIDDWTEEPIPAADVFLLPESTKIVYGAELAYYSGVNARAKIIRSRGHRYQTDAEGVVLLPPMDRKSEIVVETEKLFAHQIVRDPRTTEIVMRLRPNPRLTVAVVDANGNRVAGAPVSLMEERTEYVFQRAGYLTSSDGTFELSEFNHYSILYKNQRAKLYLKAGCLGTPDNLPKSPPVLIDDELIEAEFVELQLPTYGGVRVHLQDPNGTPLAHNGVLFVTLADSSKVDGTGYDLRRPIALLAGVAEVDFVGLEAPLSISYRPDGSRNEATAEALGPSAQGEWAEAILVFEVAPFFTGKLIDPDGNIIANKEIKVNRRVAGGSMSFSTGSRLTTNSDGEFRYEPQRLNGVTPTAMELDFSVITANAAVWDATVQVTANPIAGENPLGEIHLQVPPLLLSGTVYDLDGVPIPNAEVSIHVIEEHERGGRPYSVVKQQVRGETGLTGDFELHGKLDESANYQVQVAANRFQTLTEPVVLGTIDGKYRLKIAGVLQGVLLVPENLPHYQLDISADLPGRGGLMPRALASDPGKIEFEVVGSFLNEINLKISGSLGEVLWQKEGIKLEPGTEVRPPELQPLDLRDILLVNLLIQDADGNPLDAMIERKSDGWTHSTGSHQGKALLLSRTPWEELRIHCQGFEDRVLRSVQQDQTVVLQPLP